VAPDAPWLGMLAWGEIAPVGGEPAFHNYTYPLVVLTAA
jgi:small ligand-binding sensory domain FIST